MKLSCPTLLPWIAAFFHSLAMADPTWPSTIDELEDVMFLNTGYRSRGFGTHVTPCSAFPAGTNAGRNTASEWLRLGFHDMATTNIYFAPHGGIDASIALELNDGENIGDGFATSLITYSSFLNSQLPASDLIALGVYASIRGCGGPVISMRGGRVDATIAGPAGVPQPENGIGTFKNQFARMGFTPTEMVQMVACGHAIGGVHAKNFPTIVPAGTTPNDYGLFVDAQNFNNSIATRYIGGPLIDPLAIGIATKSGRNTDFQVFNSDKNATVQTLISPSSFNTQCATILQKMIEVVDPALMTLSDVIVPYAVKPAGLELTLSSDGALLKFSGDIRVRTTTRSASQIVSVQIAYRDRTGTIVSTAIMAAAGSIASGFDDTFSFYSFSASISATTSISAFKVTLNIVGGSTETYDNNGAWYPISDSVIVQMPQSCYTGNTLNVVAAVRSTVVTPVLLNVTQKVAVTGGSPIPSPLPVLSTSTATMVTGASLGPYNLYSGSYTLNSVTGTKYGVVSGSEADTFKDVTDLGGTCQSLGNPSSSSTFSITSSTSSISSTSILSISTLSTSSSSISPSSTSIVSTNTSSSPASPTSPAVNPTVGAYTFQGCYTEGTNIRALTGSTFVDYKAMTLEICASNCAGFTWWGVEYGGECYCGNGLNSGSKPAASSDCTFTCPGSSNELCGAGNRLQMYRLTSAITTTGTTSSPTATPTLGIVKSAGAYNYVGCYTEGTNVRALSAASFTSDMMTIEKCAAACSPYKYAGTEYGRECWCADSFGAGSTLTKDSDCSMTCTGDSYEYCGAGNRLNLYIRNGTVPTSTSPATTATPTTTIPAIKPTVSNYAYYGCQTEPSNIRALSEATLANYSSMTLETCAGFCVGYIYFGVEYGGECYCGDSFNAGSTAAPNSECSFLCPGDKLEWCGAENRLSSYVVKS